MRQGSLSARRAASDREVERLGDELREPPLLCLRESLGGRVLCGRRAESSPCCRPARSARGTRRGRRALAARPWSSSLARPSSRSPAQRGRRDRRRPPRRFWSSALARPWRGRARDLLGTGVLRCHRFCPEPRKPPRPAQTSSRRTRSRSAVRYERLIVTSASIWSALKSRCTTSVTVQVTSSRSRSA